jgi:hypothetical protein
MRAKLNMARFFCCRFLGQRTISVFCTILQLPQCGQKVQLQLDVAGKYGDFLTHPLLFPA